MYIFNKQRVAVIGATGQVGTPLTRGLLSLGHDVVVLVRSLNDWEQQLSEYKADGAEIVEVPNMLDILSSSFPDYQVTKTPAQAIADPDFVFEK